MPKDIQGTRLGGHTALLKLQCSRTIEFCAREAAQVMGGIAYTKGGQGGRVEMILREVRGVAIPGGSEEIMVSGFFALISRGGDDGLICDLGTGRHWYAPIAQGFSAHGSRSLNGVSKKKNGKEDLVRFWRLSKVLGHFV